MADRFEIIEHTADVAIAAYGADLAEALASAACGLFSLVTDLDTVGDDECRQVEVTAGDREELLAAWLNELIYISQVQNVLFSRFEVEELSDTRLRATCRGEKIDLARHRLNTEVKAATRHMLRVEEAGGGGRGRYRVQVLFDI